MMRLSFLVGCLVASLVSVTATHAQVVSPDFAGQVQPAVPTNEELVALIGQALPSGDLNQIVEQTGPTISVAEDLVQQLNLALTLAPDDAARSRIEGVLTHTQATLDSLRQIQTSETPDSAHGRLEQARGEALEALGELRPFATGLPVPEIIHGK